MARSSHNNFAEQLARSNAFPLILFPLLVIHLCLTSPPLFNHPALVSLSLMKAAVVLPKCFINPAFHLASVFGEVVNLRKYIWSKFLSLAHVHVFA